MSDNIFDEWLESGTVARQQVTIYADQAATEELDALQAELEALEKDSAPRTISEPSRARALESRFEELRERWEASRITFTLAPIERDTIHRIFEKLPNPPEPPRAAQSAPKKVKEDAEKARRAWALEVDRQEAERVLHLLAESIVRVERPGGSASSITVEQLRAMRDAKYGVPRINRLWAAYQAVMAEAAELPTPTLPGNSGSGRA